MGTAPGALAAAPRGAEKLRGEIFASQMNSMLVSNLNVTFSGLLDAVLSSRRGILGFARHGG